MDLESIMLSEISQKGTYHMISLTTHRQRKGRREGEGKGVERGSGERENKRGREGGMREREKLADTIAESEKSP